MVVVMMSMMMSVSETCLHPDICTMEEAADWDTFIATIDCSDSVRFEQCITEIVGPCTDGSPERVASEERLQAITAACSSDSPSTQPPPEETGCFADARECEQIAQQEYPDLRCGKNNYVHNCLLGVRESDSDNCSFSEEDIRHHRISNAMSCFRYIDCHNCDVPDDFPADGSFPELNPATCHRTLTALNCFRGRDFSCANWLSNQTLGEMLADVHEFCPIVCTDTVTTGDTSGSDHSSISSKSTHLAIIATLILTLANQFPYCLPRQ